MKTKFLFTVLISFLLINCYVTNVSGQNVFPANGSVGIGTLSPTELLHVNGNALISGDLLMGSTVTIVGSSRVGLFGSGSASSPSYSFSSYTSTGMFAPTSNTIGFSTGGVQRIRINSSGNVSIGTTSSTYSTEKLNVYGNIRFAGAERFIGTSDNYNFYLRTNGTNRMQIGSNGTVSILSNLKLPEGTNIVIGKENLGLDTDGIRIHYADAENQALIDYKDNLTFRNGTSGRSPLILQGNGAVAIGMVYSLASDGSQYVVPAGYKLAVAGKMIAEEVVIKLQANWPDYVFMPEYELKPLCEVKSFISTNGHLPDLPSAEQIEDNGVEVGEMNALLLKKIEELTLYILDQEERIKTLETHLESEQKKD